MTRKKVHSPRSVKAALSALVLLLFAAVAVPQVAEASTAANTTITNTVTVNYKNAAGDSQPEERATVSVTIDLVASMPTLSAPGNQSTAFGVNTEYDYTLTSTANGPDTYSLSAAIAEETGITGATVSLSDLSLTLGATTLAMDTDGTDTITVPFDGTDDDVVNGIAVGATIVINEVAYVVAGIDEDQTTPTNLAIITLAESVPAGASAGEVVGEQKSFTLTVIPGSDPAAIENAAITVTVTAQDDEATALASTDDTVTTVTGVPLPSLSVTKEVSVDGGAFVAGPANAIPGDTLTYRVTVTNTNAFSNATNVVVTDEVPQFTTYVANSTRLNGITVAGDGETSPLAGAGLLVDTNPSRTAENPATGILAPGGIAIITFQVEID